MCSNDSFTFHDHFSTSGQILNPKFEVLMVQFVFHYEIGWFLQQDLCVVEAKNGFRGAIFQNLGAWGRDTFFGRNPQQARKSVRR